MTSVPDGFDSAVGWPTQINAKVVDDCGNPMTSGNVIVSFSNGDPAMVLEHSQDGNWSGTWQARRASASQVTISLRAEIPELKIKGSVEATGGLRASQTVPVIDKSSVANLAAPGSVISILGSHLSDATAASPMLPLETELNGTSVIIAGRVLPLMSVSDGRIDALIPFDVPVNTRQQMIVQRGMTPGIPEFITMAASQPVVIDVFGLPARAGDTISIRCTGLGVVTPSLIAGSAAPSAPVASVVNPVKVVIGELEIDAVSAGLVAGSAGIYEVRVTLPVGVATGDQMPLVLRSAGQSSVPVAIAIR